MNVNELIHILENDGAGCTCCAYGACECACDAKWAENYTKQIAEMLRKQADELDVVIPRLVKANGLIENLRIKISELETQLQFEKLQVEEAVKMVAKEIQKRNK